MKIEFPMRFLGLVHGGHDRCIAMYGRARGHRPYGIWAIGIWAIGIWAMRKNRCRGNAPVLAPTPPPCTGFTDTSKFRT
jgi:hypothetical protein